MSATDANRAAAATDPTGGVLKKMNAAGKAIADNVIMTAVARMTVIIGTPVLLTCLMWFAGSFIALQQMTAVQSAEQARLVTEMHELQQYRRDSSARNAALDRDIAAIRDLIADQRQSLQSISSRLDRSLSR